MNQGKMISMFLVIMKLRVMIGTLEEINYYVVKSHIMCIFSI